LEWSEVTTGSPVSLSFCCPGCEESVNVTVVYRGGAAGGQLFDGVAAVNVPCPTCGEINRVFFEPSGALRDVWLFRPRWLLPVPSVN